jgi:tripartite motif-containing protein 71
VAVSLAARGPGVGVVRRVLGACLTSCVVAGLLIVTLASPAAASDPLTFLRMIGRPRLDAPEGVATDASGNVYVAEPNTFGSFTNDRLVKYSSDGTFLDVLASPGEGAGQVADPSGVAVAPDGTVYVTERKGSDAASNRVSYFDQFGNYIASWGTYGTGNGQFEHPEGIAVDSLGDVYVADYLNNRIQKFTSSGGWIRSWVVTGPLGIAVDGSDVVYVAGNNQIQRFDASGNALTSWGSSGAVGVAFDGSENAWVIASTAITEYDNLGGVLATYGSAGTGNGQLSNADDIAVAPSGKVFVADTDNGRIQRFSSGGVYETQWGGFPGAGVPDYPTGLAVDGSNNVYMTKKSTDQIQKFDATGTLLQEFGGSGNGNGQLNDPSAIAIDGSGNIYVLDTGNTRIQKFDPSGSYLTQWGSFGDCSLSCSDGQVKAPTGIAVDGSGHVFVADTGNNRIEEFAASDGTFIRKWGAFGQGNGQFSVPKGIAIDGSGNVWVADSGNNRIQEFDNAGNYITKWGAAGSSDGNLAAPSDLEFDSEGALWVVDKGHTRIQRFTAAGGYLSKLGSAGLDSGQFTSPSAIAIDSAGRVLVADTNNHRVQMFIDQNGPDVTITSAPGTATTLSTASFSFTANDFNATFKCKIDGGAYADCTSGSPSSSYSGLSEGSHTFWVYATDTLANPGNPTSYVWSVDTTAPSVNLTSTPPLTTGSTSASFSFTSDEAGIFKCSLGSSSFATCTSPDVVSVAAGSNTFHVKAIDLAGNVSQTVSYTWTVDKTPPNVTITSGPTGYVQSTSASFSFTSSDSSATFECHLDGFAWAPCTSPADYPGLSAGLHTFYVRATDQYGNVGSTVHQAWTVDTQTHKPDGQIATGTTYVGNDIYNSDGSNQTKTLKSKVGKTVTFKIRFQNDGTGTDGYLVKGTASGKGYTVAYYAGTTNITSKVTGGTYKVNVPAAQYGLITLKVTVGTKAAASRSFLVKAWAEHETTRLDAVKAVVKRT